MGFLDKISVSKLFAGAISSVVYFDDVDKSIYLYYKENDGKGNFVCVAEPFNHNPSENGFFTALSNVVKIHFNKKAFGKTALVLPDYLFFTDTIKLPLIQKKAVNSSLSVAFNNIYSNSKDLKYLAYPLFKDKKNIIYNVVGIQKQILEAAFSALSSIGVDVWGVTFASNSAVDKALHFNSKLKNSGALLIDVKSKFTRFSLVVDGRAISFFSLPFGYSAFSESEVIREACLFDHSSAELLVLNSKEKAKNKKLTTYDSTPDMLGVENFLKSVVGDVSDNQDESSTPSETPNAIADEFDESDEESVVVTENSRGRHNKVLKKLPKYLIRPTPETKEGFIYENFRPIVKWALEIIQGNQEVFANGLPKNVLVNIPAQFNSVFDFIKAEGESEVTFLPLADTEHKDTSNLELFGGLLIGKRNKHNVF